jgi:hypothetical protein
LRVGMASGHVFQDDYGLRIADMREQYEGAIGPIPFPLVCPPSV